MVTRSVTNQGSLKALDWLNVFLADIQGSVGPFLVIYLTSSLQWNPAQVGLVMKISGLTGVIAQTPIEALVDQLHQKRSLIIIAAVLVAISSIATVTIRSFPIITISQSFTAIAGAFFGPTLADIALSFFWFFIPETKSTAYPVSSKSELATFRE